MDSEKKFQDFFTNDEIIFFDSLDMLSDKLNFYKNNQTLSRKIAENGKKKYFKLFNEIEVANYIVKKSLDPNSKYKPIWEREIINKR